MPPCSQCNGIGENFYEEQQPDGSWSMVSYCKKCFLKKMCEACVFQVASQVINSNGSIRHVCSDCATKIAK